MKKILLLTAVLLFGAFLLIPVHGLAHEGEHSDDDHDKNRSRHGTMEEGSGTYGGEYSGHGDKKYDDHGKHRGEYRDEGSGGMQKREHHQDAEKDEGSGSMQKREHHQEHKREGS